MARPKKILIPEKVTKAKTFEQSFTPPIEDITPPSIEVPPLPKNDSDILKRLAEIEEKENVVNESLREKIVVETTFPALGLNQAAYYDNVLKRRGTDTALSVKLMIKANPNRYKLL